jgi:hypothetical protein
MVHEAEMSGQSTVTTLQPMPSVLYVHLTSTSTSCVEVSSAWRSTAPVRCASICQGTKLPWCSATDSTICKQQKASFSDEQLHRVNQPSTLATQRCHARCLWYTAAVSLRDELHLIALSDVVQSPGLRDEVDGLRGIACEHHLPVAGCSNEGRDL